MELSQTVIVALVVAAVAASLCAAILSLVALSGQRAVRRSHAQSYEEPSGDGSDDVLGTLDRHLQRVRRLSEEVGAAQEEVARLREQVRGGLSRVATVRYDAFDDMGGRLSFSTALLDEQGNGVVFTSINGRAETRTYAKPVTGSESRHNLSDEEVEAIDRAMGLGGRPGATWSDPEVARAPNLAPQ